jgi:hypothetical protein
MCAWFGYIDYFQGISETILYLLLPGEIYGCTAVGSLAQDLLVNYILIPVLNLFSEPDFVNQYVIWLVSPLRPRED